MDNKIDTKKPTIDRKTVLIAILIILGVFTAGQLGFSIPVIITVSSKSMGKLLGSIFLLVGYINCGLAIIVGSILGYFNSTKSIAVSENKTLGYATLVSSIVSDVALIIPTIILVIKLLPR